MTWALCHLSSGSASLAKIKITFWDKIHHSLETPTCDPLDFIMDSPTLLYQYVWKGPSESKGIKFYIDS